MKLFAQCSISPLSLFSSASSITPVFLMLSRTSEQFVSSQGYISASKSLIFSTGMEFRYTLQTAYIIAICSATSIGAFLSCFKTSTMRAPRSSLSLVSLSRSEPNCANAWSSLYCEYKSFRGPIRSSEAAGYSVIRAFNSLPGGWGRPGRRCRRRGSRRDAGGRGRRRWRRRHTNR